jgi:rhodanese-related sulfurtransferase
MKLLDKTIIKEVIFLSVFSGVVAFYFNRVNPAGVPIIYTKDKVLFAEDLDEQQDRPTAVKISQAIQLYNSPNTVFLDARLPADYEAGHIKGSLNMPVEIYNDYLNVVENIDYSTTLVTYCSDKECALSEELADSLKMLGFKKVYVFLAGWLEWKKGGNPVRKGTQP